MKMHDMVALVDDLPEHNLRRGQVGTIVEQWAENVYEVEFAGTDGIPYAMVAVPEEKLMVLHWQTNSQQQAS